MKHAFHGCTRVLYVCSIDTYGAIAHIGSISYWYLAYVEINVDITVDINVDYHVSKSISNTSFTPCMYKVCSLLFSWESQRILRRNVNSNVDIDFDIYINVDDADYNDENANNSNNDNVNDTDNDSQLPFPK